MRASFRRAFKNRWILYAGMMCTCFFHTQFDMTRSAWFASVTRVRQYSYNQCKPRTTKYEINTHENNDKFQIQKKKNEIKQKKMIKIRIQARVYSSPHSLSRETVARPQRGAIACNSDLRRLSLRWQFALFYIHFVTTTNETTTWILVFLLKVYIVYIYIYTIRFALWLCNRLRLPSARRSISLQSTEPIP